MSRRPQEEFLFWPAGESASIKTAKGVMSHIARQEVRVAPADPKDIKRFRGIPSELAERCAEIIHQDDELGTVRQLRVAGETRRLAVKVFNKSGQGNQEKSSEKPPDE